MLGGKSGIFVFTGFFQFIFMLLNFLRVSLTNVIDKVFNHHVRVLSVSGFLFNKFLCLVQEPGENITGEDILFEMIHEEATVSKVQVSGELEVLVERLGDLTAANLFVSLALLLFPAFLKQLLPLVLFEPLTFKIFIILDFKGVTIIRLFEVLLCLLHDGEFFLLEDFHAGLLKRLTAKNGQDGFYLVVE